MSFSLRQPREQNTVTSSQSPLRAKQTNPAVGLGALSYAVGLLLVLVLSPLLLPADSGLGRLLWGSLSYDAITYGTARPGQPAS